ncbi:hypothetical protein [Lichenihabitans psoromatis]|uniref:hypothetical protein n=1 Tax=Lichenihabitans psoromatis TaxID=2528642 RepID=UPI00103842B7|nr:hypothetical protein [Lichenihabitans psoromatis]
MLWSIRASEPDPVIIERRSFERRVKPIIRFILGLAAAIGIFSLSSHADAAAHCMARVIANVGAEEAPEQVKSKSVGTFGPVTQIKVDKTTGRMVYCGEKTYCYWSNAFEIITPCRIKRDEEMSDGRYFSYSTR